MSQLDQAMATLRISLATVQHKEQQLESVINQFRAQMRRLPRQVIYGKTPLEVSLSAFAEIEERLADALATRRRLLAIKKSAQEELEALQLVQRVDEARRSLADLRQRLQVSGDEEEILVEVRRLEQFIAEHSKRAEAAITASYQERQQVS